MLNYGYNGKENLDKICIFFKMWIEKANYSLNLILRIVLNCFDQASFINGMKYAIMILFDNPILS